MKYNILLLLFISLLFIQCEKTINIDNEPQLQIKVIDVNKNPVSNAMVIIYLNEDDYKNNRNIVVVQNTNNIGNVFFENLESEKYWIRAQRGNRNNYYDFTNIQDKLSINKKDLLTITIK